MRYTRRRTIVMGAAGAAGLAGLRGAGASFAREHERLAAVDGRVVAVGIAEASAVAAIGTFLPGGPIHDTPALAASTQTGRVLDPTRILVAGRSNFGAPKADGDQSEGALLSIDPRETELAVPPAFAGSGEQAAALGGAVQLYCAQSPAWRNGVHNPTAVTAGQTAVSNPLGLSINNAFGRLWPANAPYGLDGPGSSTIDDPDGRPLKGAPNARTGGAYFGDLSGRRPAQIIPGALARAAVGTAFLGRSPDGSGRAVFCVVVADGSIVQEHTAKAPVKALSGRRRDRGHDGEDDRELTPRLGAIVNYVPALILYVSQPTDDSVVAIDLAIGGPAGDEVFVPTAARVIRSRALDVPVDLAPVHVESGDPNWSSNTTMEEGSDFYVCNAGNATIARMRQDGTAVATRRVRARGRPLGHAVLNGIATSRDGSRLWVTYAGRLHGDGEPERGRHGDRDGGVLELPAF